MGPRPACSFREEIHNFFSQTRQGLARQENISEAIRAPRFATRVAFEWL